MNYKDLIKKINKEKMPEHIAIIMDGNGRWADKHGKQRIEGHSVGRDTVRSIVEASVEIGLKHLTIYAFSTENWRRSDSEVDYLLKLILNSLLEEIKQLSENNVIIRFIGSQEGLESDYVKQVTETCKLSEKNTGLRLNVAFNYGGRKEVIDSVKSIFEKIKTGELTPKDINEETVSEHLYTAGTPDPDLIIRTSGEQRISNFLMWQSVYSEFWFTPTLWPDFSKAEFMEAILEYQNRKRRFGARI
ncbi:MAG: isoprenyl transferase [Candidatus Cloacimonadota bacterium]|nr:MAG: isoprenyl transferase [Candidatus Cloacimonadota bacterium]